MEEQVWLLTYSHKGNTQVIPYQTAPAADRAAADVVANSVYEFKASKSKRAQIQEIIEMIKKGEYDDLLDLWNDAVEYDPDWTVEIESARFYDNDKCDPVATLKKAEERAARKT